MEKKRPNSARSSSCSASSKIKMQTKYKNRNGGGPVMDANMSMQKSLIINDQNSQKSRGEDRKKAQSVQPAHKQIYSSSLKKQQKLTHQSSKSFAKDNEVPILSNKDEFLATKIMTQSFQHHHKDKCVCQKCTCGRHLCKLQSDPPNLTKISTYTNDFNKKSGIRGPLVIAKQYGKLEGPYLSLGSTYGDSFPTKVNDDLNRPKPQDMLKTGGVSQNLTSYAAQYPCHRGKNQYVKPTDNHRRQKFPLRGRTTYNSFFVQKDRKLDDWEGVRDCIKPGTGWYCDSSYKNSFKTPNPENFPLKVTVTEKLEEKHGYKHQFETTYLKDFIKPETAVCEAKIILESKRNGEYKNSKINFMENSDYKAMSPQFRSYSANRCI